MAIALSALVMFMLGREWKFTVYPLTLLPASEFNETYAVPYWTLVYEMVFYAIIYACIVLRRSRRQIAILLTMWAGIIALACQIGVHAFPSDREAMLVGKWILLSPANFEFIAGALYGLVGKEVLKTANPLTLAIQAVICVHRRPGRQSTALLHALCVVGRIVHAGPAPGARHACPEIS